MHNIKYSNQAEFDLENAISYIAKDSKQNAISYLLRYEEKIELLKYGEPFFGKGTLDPPIDEVALDEIVGEVV